jgi:hypothetical protein
MALADDGPGLFFGPAKSGHQYRHQQCDNRDYNQELYQGETFVFIHNDIPVYSEIGLKIRELV